MSLPWPIEPMTAVSGDLPADAERWGLELKWDGVRVVAQVGGGVRAAGRRGTDVADRYPELSGLADLLPGRTAVLDGEIVAFDGGLPSFGRLQRRMHVERPHARLVREVPVRYIVFDLLSLDGRDVVDLPYAERRALLDGLGIAAGGPVEVPPYLNGADAAQVKELLAYTLEQRLEGLLAKRLDSPYRPGSRVPHWRKVKNFLTREAVVCGYKPGKGRRAGGVGSLLLGEYDAAGRLRYLGHVGTGFTDRALDELDALLAPLLRDASPYAEPLPRDVVRDARWVEPRLVGDVAYGALTDEGRLRHPAWRGLRDDKDPREVTDEQQ
ncbi:non-homologous end-joining DNA ligase [Actinomadura atramentaria]|uniref:non-homologous end-joining DNA ligase n=1 Tax=Actinomadura atramentaria TaxID=1990 RepID=UPI0003818779|nr:non-homologous end-joining DNA ligase [Actinomadura atramentaria]